MTPFNSLIFGLGLFFLGLRLIGDNLRRLTGPSFRSVIKRSTRSPALGGVLGVISGALMQSATAVTFVLMSMTGSGLIKPAAAAPIIIWCNVGLTALAFVATLDLQPYVALIVGGAGIVMGTIRQPRWQTAAGAVLGLGLILVGLEQMGAGAAPLKEVAGFRDAMAAATSNPLLAFLTGLAAAASLQSNTGAVMLVITLASGGLFELRTAMLIIYGTNLGAIGLRLFLSTGLQGEQLRLVRLEDLFCVVSALLMLGLYAAEAAGVPLGAALVRALSHSLTTQLAIIFLLSNLLPALVMTPSLKAWRRFLEKLWPDKPAADDPSQPLFLRKQALDDPPTALDLLGRELARLLGMIRIEPANAGPDDDKPGGNFQNLAQAIESFAAKLASRNAISEETAQTLHLRRAQLSLIRHIEEAVRYFSTAASHRKESNTLDAPLTALLALATKASEKIQPGAVRDLYEKTRLKGKSLRNLQAAAHASGAPLSATANFEDFAMAVWTLHRLSKLLARLAD